MVRVVARHQVELHAGFSMTST